MECGVYFDRSIRTEYISVPFNCSNIFSKFEPPTMPMVANGLIFSYKNFSKSVWIGLRGRVSVPSTSNSSNTSSLANFTIVNRRSAGHRNSGNN